MVLPSPRSSRLSLRHAGFACLLGGSAALCSTARIDAQSVVCWGRNLEGQCTLPSNLGDTQLIAGGLYHTVALRADGSVVCWGSASDGQTAVPAGLGTVTAVAAGHFHTLAVRAGGTVAAWGRNVEGQSAVPAGLASVAAVSAGWKHSVALRNDGSVVAWGSNTLGQLNVPATLGVATRIAAGGLHTLALRSTGTVAAWGAGTTSTGINPNFGQSIPPAGLAGVVGIAAGNLHSAAVKSDGTVACWGQNSLGQCSTPAGLSGVVAVAAGNAHTVALRANGTIVAWGNNSSGQVVVPGGLAPASAVVAGGQHTAAIVAAVPVIVVVSTTPESCARMNGAVDVTVSHASTLSWTGPNGFVSSAADLPAVAAGTYTLTASGPGGSASQTVVVPGLADTTPPSIASFTASITRDAGLSCTGQAFDFAATVVASDDCSAPGALLVTQQPAAGTALGLGTHAITITVRDASGNASTAQASFTVAGTPQLFCADLDRDGFGDPQTIGTYCQEPQGGVANDDDCDDQDPHINPLASEECDGRDNDCDSLTDEDQDQYTYYRDQDGDGFGKSGETIQSCQTTPPPGYSAVAGDCNDLRADVYPGAVENCANDGIDNDCDGQGFSDAEAIDSVPYYPDLDQDGYGKGTAIRSCTPIAGRVTDNTDCNDSNAAINPGASERCDAANVDEDCDGLADNLDPSALDATKSNFYRDADTDGYGAGAAERYCDRPAGYSASDTDCNDADGAINPGAQEICDGANTDEDCDQTADDGDPSTLASSKSSFYRDSDGDGQGAGAAVLFCDLPTGYSANSNDCNDLDKLIFSGAPERCNGISDDCDAEIDEDLVLFSFYPDADEDTFGDETAAPTKSCGPIAGKVLDNTDCDDADETSYPGAPELCANATVDNDCDLDATEIDANAADKVDYYRDQDGDFATVAETARFCPGTINPGWRSSPSAEGDCNDDDNTVYPTAPELCANATVDNDCDLDAAEIDANAADKVDYYRDQDNDSFTTGETQRFCPGTDNPGWRSSPSAEPDCNDMQFQYRDGDGDGAGAGAPVACGVPSNDDCDDGDIFVYPGAPELCANLGTDNDCDGVNTESEATDRSTFYRDADNDQYTGSSSALFCAAPPGYEAADEGDCDDGDNTVYPTAPELCANATVDNDCDLDAAEIDANAADKVDYYRDEDNDSFTTGETQRFCPGTDNPGWRSSPSAEPDCNDMQFQYRDGDGDGAGAGAPVACGVPSNDDCDDGDIFVYPGAPELCANLGTDNDCDGVNTEGEATDRSTFYRDADNDQYTGSSSALFCAAPPGYEAADEGDCNDDDNTVYPTAPELCANATVDNDCDLDATEIDANAADKIDCYRDQDGDSFTTGEIQRFCPGVVIPGWQPAPSAEPDCDDLEFQYRDGDGDGAGAGAPVACGVPSNDDCDDGDNTVYPTAPELCANATVDNDCDLDAAEIDANAADKVDYYRDEDNDSFTTGETQRFCPGTDNPGWRSSPSANPDCDDMQFQYRDGDGDGAGAGAPVACGVPWNDDCDDGDSFIYPGAPELCANLGTDNDCDGNATEVDPADPVLVDYYRDADHDTFTTAETARFCPGTTNPGWRSAPSSPADCDDDSPAVYPGATERCGDLAVDNDCDGSVAESEAIDRSEFCFDADADGFGSDADPAHPSGLYCSAPAGYVGNCSDGCPADSGKQAPGVCGCGAADSDANGNGEADCLDFVFSLTPSTEALGPGDALVVTLRSSYPTGSSPSAPLRALGFQAAFGFDPARFRLESIAPIADGPFPLALGTSIDNAAGRAVFSATVSEVDFGNPDAGMTAEAPLATLVFTAIEALPDCTAVGLVAVLPNNGAATPIVTRLTTETASGLRTRIPVATPIVAIRIDDVAPVVVVDGAGAPADIELPMDAGSDFGAFVAEPEIAVTDNCEPEPSIVLAVVFPDGSAAANWPADGMFPVGVTMLRLAADDGAGNETIVEWTITVLPHYLLDLRLGFNSCIESPTTRAIRITGLPVPALASPIVVTFPAWTGSTSNPASVDGLVIPRDAAIGCVAAKDTAATIAPTAYPSHSLTARFGDLVVVGTRYRASVVLFQGDSDDNDRIDIIDYGIFAQDRGAGKPDYARSNFNGDSEVDNGDFGALSVNFFRTGETCSAGALAGEPLSRISLKELRRRGLGHLAGADLNGDGWLDLTDVQLFIEGGGGPAVRPSHSGTERQP